MENRQKIKNARKPKEEILQVILSDPALTVLESTPQYAGTTGKVVDNGFEEVYVNAKEKDGAKVSELMEVFVDDAAYNSKFPVTSGSKRRYKETEEGQQVMCEIMETKDKDFQMQLMIELLPEET